MAKKKPLLSMLMLLCFGTSIVSLVVYWYTFSDTNQSNNSPSMILRTNPNSNEHNPDFPSGITIGDSALGADMNFSSNSGDGEKNSRLVVPTQQNKTNSGLKGFFFGGGNDSPSPGAGNNQTDVVVDLSDRRVYVYRYDQVMASYPIAVGKKGWETPTGTFKVIHKEHHPIWKHPITGKIFEAGTDSPLGDRWIGFWSDGKNEIGFHGTPNKDLIGGAVSHGCLRMRNPDVRMLYEQVDLGTPVSVRH
ncbi:L,D-transpeptidase [Cylindrospermopsis raciborskii]|uniref:L,D-transpeptidase n=2 Tax=Cylindrospermopsis raciborskii TaxID=77022 RepID=UPI0007789AB5|nr:L,D-transpeptidase [Cylindrospermopsis raciborskii]MCZ2202170.1 L,D-transpeptidase [Cylindrospermopsis raciborskii PAMP2012]MCZ2205290.1 L,D-transpeptidase [Cylindrospermopsis raciborskii PAMP2011]